MKFNASDSQLFKLQCFLCVLSCENDELTHVFAKKMAAKFDLPGECQLYCRLLRGRRSHRHHIFVRRSLVAARHVTRCVSDRRYTKDALTRLERAATACVLEARMSRVDTLGLATALLAVGARLHSYFSSGSVSFIESSREEEDVFQRKERGLRERTSFSSALSAAAQTN